MTPKRWARLRVVASARSFPPQGGWSGGEASLLASHQSPAAGPFIPLTRVDCLNIILNMKTIAISIDEPLLERLDQLVRRRSSRGRSEEVRRAVEEYLTRLERLAEEDREREVFSRNRDILLREAVALVREQAEP